MMLNLASLLFQWDINNWFSNRTSRLSYKTNFSNIYKIFRKRKITDVLTNCRTRKHPCSTRPPTKQRCPESLSRHWNQELTKSWLNIQSNNTSMQTIQFSMFRCWRTVMRRLHDPTGRPDYRTDYRSDSWTNTCRCGNHRVTPPPAMYKSKANYKN